MRSSGSSRSFRNSGSHQIRERGAVRLPTSYPTIRMPTVERIKATYWNPEGPILPGKVFGAGWALNVGAIVARFTKSGG